MKFVEITWSTIFILDNNNKPFIFKVRLAIRVFIGT